MVTEQRLIDANDAEQYAREHILDANERYTILDFLRECATVDAVEVVRCEKCRYYFDGACANYKNHVAIRVPDFGDNYKYVDELQVAKDHFCSFGERRKDG